MQGRRLNIRGGAHRPAHASHTVEAAWNKRSLNKHSERQNAGLFLPLPPPDSLGFTHLSSPQDQEISLGISSARDGPQFREVLLPLMLGLLDRSLHTKSEEYAILAIPL